MAHCYQEATASLMWGCRAPGASPGDRHTERGADLHGEGAAEMMSRPCITREVRRRYLWSLQKLCKDRSLSHAR